jgi:hypothetical protein
MKFSSLRRTQNRVGHGGSINTPDTIYVTICGSYSDPRWRGVKAQIDVNYNGISNTRLNHGGFSTEIYLNLIYAQNPELLSTRRPYAPVSYKCWL